VAPSSATPISRPPEENTKAKALTPLFLVVSFLSAFALFQIQPLMSKLILPWFGGGPWVWAVCLAFFQGLLLAGYVYSHVLTDRAPVATQVRFHSILLALGAGLLLTHEWTWPLAILPGSAWHPHGQSPMLSILGLLTVGIGLPYFLLAATSPLIQSWFSRIGAGSPYRLYAMSNLGSLVGLLSYPLVVEPTLDTRGQSHLWLFMFVGAALSCSAAGFAVAARTPRGQPEDPGRGSAASHERPSVEAYLKWFAYAAIPSALLVSTTTLMTETVAAVPLLWVVPLALYLVTLIAAFHSERWHQPGLFHPLFAFSGFAASVALSPWGALLDAPRALAIFASALFFGAWACHAELARARPAPAHLTLYYVVMSMGGAFGSALVSFGAPFALSDFWEFHICLFVCAAAILLALLNDPDSWLRRHKAWVTLVPVAAMLLAGGRLGLFWLTPSMVRAGPGQITALLATVAVMGWLAFRERGKTPPSRPFSIGQLLMALLLLPFGMSLVDAAALAHHGVIARSRSFYGVLTVEEVNRGHPREEALILQDGVTTHGVQLKDPARRTEPTSYYHRDTAIYRAFAALVAKDPDRPLRMGVIGLGTGTLAAYARPGDFIHYYEIDPNDIRFAQEFFSFLADSKGDIELTQGDGRLSRREERDAGQWQGFDLLVLDAFNGATLPVHLLRAEAFDLYRAHLRGSSSLIGVNISSRFLDLEPVIAHASNHLGFRSTLTSSTDREAGRHPVTWALLSQDSALLASASATGTRPAEGNPRTRLWTDEYSDVAGVLRWWRR